MNELILVESQAARNEFANRTDVLQKVKKLSLLPDDVYVTVQMTAAYYESPKKTVETLIRSHRRELEQDGLRVLSGEELKQFATLMTKVAKDDTLLTNRTRHLTVLPRRAVLRIGMLLRDSEVAKQVRTYLLNMEHQGQQPVRSSNNASELTAKADTLRWVAANTKVLLELLPDGTERRKVVANVYAFAGIAFPASDTRSAERSASKPLTLVPSPGKWYSCQTIAMHYGLYTINHNPHAQLVGAIIRTFGELVPGVDWKPLADTRRWETRRLGFAV